MSETAEAETGEKPEEERPTEEKPMERAEPAGTRPKSKKRKGIHEYYKVEEDKLKRKLPFCERCGPGYFMANHDNRYTCGHCGFTRYKPAETIK